MNNSSRPLIWMGMFLGSIIGGYIPNLWGAGLFSVSSLFVSTAGAIIGIYIGFKLSQ